MDNKKMNELQDQLDIAVFEQEEMDVDKVKEILDKMESISPEEDKKGFDKENLWKRIEEQSREEFAEEQIVAFDRIKAVKKSKGASVGAGGAGRGAKIRRIAMTAATIVLAVFIGANIGTYATEKKNVFEYVGDLKNGTAFWITGDAPGMEFEEEIEVYYSWNDIPSEYREFLFIPQGLPDELRMYDIKVLIRDTFAGATIRYINNDATCDFTIQITNNYGDELTLGNLIYEEEYELLESDMVGNIDINYYSIREREIMSLYVYKNCIYTITTTLEKEELQGVIEKTLGSII